MPYPDDQDEKHLLLNLIYDSVVTNAYSPQTHQLALQGSPSKWVLGEPGESEGRLIEEALARAAESVEALLRCGVERVMNELNSKS